MEIVAYVYIINGKNTEAWATTFLSIVTVVLSNYKTVGKNRNEVIKNYLNKEYRK